MKVTLRIIRPSSREPADLLGPRLDELAAAGFEVLHDEIPRDPDWPYTAAPTAERAQALAAALTESRSDFVLCARGGYGASDLLPRLDWSQLASAKPKLVVGFSDVSALHSALYTRLGWPGLHAPMPATTLWRKDGQEDDVGQLLALLKTFQADGTATGSLAVQPVGTSEAAPLVGPLFGGCFTVLTNLIGTPYFPRSLAGHVVFIEDTGEHPARLMRALNQWLLAGVLDGARALVVGYLRDLGDKIPDCAPFVYQQFAARVPVPVYATPLFGHTSPNHPLLIGADAVLGQGRLTWRYRRESPGSQRSSLA